MQIFLSSSKTKALTVNLTDEGLTLTLLTRKNASDSYVKDWQELDHFKIKGNMDLRLLAGSCTDALETT